MALLLGLVAGCTRRYYREFADRDVYRIENERQTDPRWAVPPRPVEADPRSRIATIGDPDHQPIPPDDPSARPFQVTAGRPLEFAGWSKRGMTPVEDLRWVQNLPKDKDGKVVLNPAAAMQIALMNSRDYQTNVEDVYLQALLLTGTRFTFFPQLFANQTTQFRQFGAGSNGSSQLQLFTNDAFNWSLYSGATILTNFANSLVFEYDGRQFETVLSGLTINLTQPLLRGAFARNVTQPLSVAERAMLYRVRDFARYRRTFYVDVVTGYLRLLTQLQLIRNQQALIQQTRRNLDEYEALVRADFLEPIQRDNLAQTYQQARLQLLSQEANFQTSLDAYRVSILGLPADFPLTVDEGLLRPFELNDPRLDALRGDNDRLYLELQQFDEPPAREVLAAAARRLLVSYGALREVATEVGGELKAWRTRLASEVGRVGEGPGPIEQDEKESLARQQKLAADIGKAYDECLATLGHNVDNVEEYLEKLGRTDPLESFLTLRQNYVARAFRDRLNELFVIQTQARVYLIEVKPVDLTLEQAISVGLANRLDLMNTLGQVTDAWRNVEVDGNRLLAGLNAFYTGNLATQPNHLGVLRFDAHNSLQLVGLRFDAPIVRRSERNQYRGDQIAFQRARRAYMLNHDAVVRDVRLDMRNLNLNRRQFEISREALLIAARQVDSAELQSRTAAGAAPGGQSTSLLLQQALTSLLTNKNNLIGNWVDYEIVRMGLFRDFDLMTIDARGVWTNDDRIPNLNGGPAPAVRDPLSPPAERLLPGPDPAGSAGELRTDEIGPSVPRPDPVPAPPADGRPGPFSRP